MDASPTTSISYEGQEKKGPLPLLLVGCFASYFFFLLVTQQLQFIHWFVLILLLGAYTLNRWSRLWLFLTLPFFVKSVVYDLLRWIPFDFIQPVHVAGPYLLEKSLFGISISGATLLLPQILNLWRNPFFDIYTGILYALPDFFYFSTILWLWKKRGMQVAWQFSCAFCFMNFLAFLTYVFFPVAPPWYVEQYGLVAPMAPVLGNAAGIRGFESLLGIDFISKAYQFSPVVFGAIPSMHMGYACCISWFLFPSLSKRWIWILPMYVGSVAFAALYLNHHYVIDLILGAIYAAVAATTISGLKKWVTASYLALKPFFVFDKPAASRSVVPEGIKDIPVALSQSQE